MIEVKATGGTDKLERFIAQMKAETFFNLLDHYGQEGVNALAAATPTDSGLTAQSWTYEITHKRGRHSIIWHNTNVNDGMPVAVLIQYGHGTGTGGYVQGRDYINPVILPLFDKIADAIWNEVRNA